MNLKTIAGTVTSLSIIFIGFVTVETRYAKAADLEELLQSNEQKIVWDLEENIDTSEGKDKLKWYKRLKEKVDEFCDDYPDEDECDREYLEEIKDELEGL